MRLILHFLVLVLAGLAITSEVVAQTRWIALGRGLYSPLPIINAVVPLGKDVYVGGAISRAGTTPVSMIARWSWVQRDWTSLDGGVNSNVSTILPIIEGSDTLLYIGGFFSVAGNSPCQGLAVWNPSTRRWECVIYSLGGGDAKQVATLLRDKSQLYVGGTFSSINRMPASCLAVYDLSSRQWRALGRFEQRDDTLYGDPLVKCMVKIGDTLYVGGGFTHVNGIRAVGIALYNVETQRWDSVPGARFVVGAYKSVLPNAMVSLGDSLIIGGQFSTFGGQRARGLLVYHTKTGRWSELAGGIWRDTVSSSVKYFAVFALATDGKRLYVGGSFDTAGTIPARNIAVYDFASARWDSLESGTNGRVTALALDSSYLYVGGGFLNVGRDNLRVNYIAAWRMDTTTMAVNVQSRESAPMVYVAGTQLRFSVPEAGWVQVRLFDSRGGMVGVLYRGWCEVGEYGVELPAVVTGMYAVQLWTQSHHVTVPVVIQRYRRCRAPLMMQ